MSSSKLTIVRLVGVLLICFCGPAAASEAPFAPVEEEQEVESLDRSHAKVSESLENAAARVDAFFGQERAYEEATGTYLQWRLGGTWEDGGGLSLESKIRVKLRLPWIERRARLLLETDPKEDLEEGIPVETGPGAALREASDNNNFAGALEFSWQKLESWTISATPGVKFTIPLDPFVRFRARRSVEFETWVARFTEKVAWFNSSGWEASTSLDLDRPVGETDLFRSTSQVDWNAEDDNFFPSQFFLYYHKLGPRDALSFRAGVVGELRPVNRPTSFLFNVGYRRRIYKKWLFSDLTPQVAYNREDDFNPTWSVNLRLEALFGARYL